MKPWIENGTLLWCDKSGNAFPDASSMEKAKRTGDAYMRIRGSCGLPSPYALTGDERWAPGGELYEVYDLGADENGEEIDVEGNDVLPGGKVENEVDVSSLDIPKDEASAEDGVKAFSEITDVKNKNDDSTGFQRSYSFKDISPGELAENFSSILGQ